MRIKADKALSFRESPPLTTIDGYDLRLSLALGLFCAYKTKIITQGE